MAGRIPPSEQFGHLRQKLEDLQIITQDLSRLDGAQYLRLYEKMQDLIANLDVTVTNLVTDLTYTRTQINESQAAQNDALAAATWDASRITSGTLAPVRGGTGTPNTYENDLSASTRRSAWVTDAGVLGYAPSTRASKQDIEPAEFTTEHLRTMTVCLYRYRSAVAREAWVHEFDCVAAPYSAPTEIGVIADDLDAAGLWPFVMYEGHGDAARPVGVHIELIGLAALRLAQLAFDAVDDIQTDIADLRRQIGVPRATE